MRYMMMMKADKDYEAGKPPSPELIAAVSKLTEGLVKSGVMVGGGGLAPSSKGAKLQLKDGEVTVIDGPFTETKEVIGGYAIMNFNTKEEAIQSAKEFLKLHAEILGKSYQCDCEVRQMYEDGECGQAD